MHFTPIIITALAALTSALPAPEAAPVSLPESALSIFDKRQSNCAIGNAVFYTGTGLSGQTFAIYQTRQQSIFCQQVGGTTAAARSYVLAAVSITGYSGSNCAGNPVWGDSSGSTYKVVQSASVPGFQSFRITYTGN